MSEYLLFKAPILPICKLSSSILQNEVIILIKSFVTVSEVVCPLDISC